MQREKLQRCEYVIEKSWGEVKEMMQVNTELTVV